MSKKISARAGEEFEVKLQGLPGAGYKWQLQNGGEHVELVQEDTVASKGALGAAAEQRFVLRPKRSGDFVLQFGLKRPWEEKVEESQTVEVRVSDAGPKRSGPKRSGPKRSNAATKAAAGKKKSPQPKRIKRKK